MPITKCTSAPLFVVVGATGTQGRSVIDALSSPSTHAHASTSSSSSSSNTRHTTQQEFRVRAVTRNLSHPTAPQLAKAGCEVVAADLGNAPSVMKALEGASVVFAMTATDTSSPDGWDKVRSPALTQAVQSCDFCLLMSIASRNRKMASAWHSLRVQ